MAAPSTCEVLVRPFTASADLSSYQYYFVKISDDREVTVCAALTDVPIGVLQNAPESGQTAVVMVIGETPVSSDAALTAGNLIGPSADGQADARTIGTDTTHYVCGQVVAGSSAAGAQATAIINCANLGRAA